MGVVLAFAAVVQPGPFQAFLFSQSIANGWRKTIPMAFAPLMSDGPIIILVLFVLTKLPKEFLQILQLAGGLLLIFLAYGAFNTYRKFNEDKQNLEVTQKSVFKAVMVNFLNPAPYLGWSLVMGPLLVKAWDKSLTIGFTFILGFYVTMIICTMAMIILFSAARNLGPKVSRISIGFSAILMAAFGVYQIWSGFNLNMFF
jgi:threonine/homoserine/homoserine lactone efflux protein